MYASAWSIRELPDPAPCFRQGDLVRVRYTLPNLVQTPQGFTVDGVRDCVDLAALVSHCCDLVIRPKKRRGVLVCPVGPIPLGVSSNPPVLAALKMTVAEALAANASPPASLFYYSAIDDPGDPIAEGAASFDVITPIPYDFLRSAVKIAELTDASREDFQDRLKYHFARELAPP